MANGDSHDDDPRYDWLYDKRSSKRQRPRSRRPAQGSPPPVPPPAPPPASPDDQSTRMIPGRSQTPYAQDPNAQDPNAQDPYAQDPYGDRTRAMPAAAPGQYPQNYPPQDYPPQPPPPRQPPPGGPPPSAMRGGPRRPRRRFPIVRTILLLLLAYVVFLVAIPIMSWNRVEKVDVAAEGDRPEDTPGTTYLLVGSDSREGLSDEEKSDFGTGNAGGKRTDTIMLLHTPRGFGTPVLISLPRDSYVNIPGRDKNKINAAFSFGGPKLLAETVEQNTGLRVDKYVEIGFGGFVGVVNALGGVELCPKQDMDDEKAHVNLKAGCQDMDGKTALGYVRARYSDSKGDLGRVERQQEFLNAVGKSALSPGLLINPVKYTRFGFASGDALTAGEGTGVFDMMGFVLAMRAVSSGGGVSMTVPISSTNYSTPAGSAVKWDTEKARALFGAIGEGDDVPTELLPDKDDSGN